MTDDPETIEHVTSSVLRELEEDYVEMWVIAWRLRRAKPTATTEELRKLAATVLARLLKAGARLGDDTDDGFVEWENGADVLRAMRAWAALGRDPNMGEIAWLDLPNGAAPP